MRKLFFTPGPSGLYYTVEQHLKEAVKTGVTSISHRSKDFMKIYQEADENLRELLQLPADYAMVFSSSATEIWEKLTDSMIQNKSLHIVNGAFSNKFYSVADNLGKDAEIHKSEWGTLPDSYPAKSNSYDLIGVTHNETSTGVQTPLPYIYKLKEDHPQAILAIDAVSSLPVVNFDYTKIDTVYASVQKAFGLPAGLGLWLINKNTQDKARSLFSEGKIRLSSHNIISLLDQAQKYQTPSTPNVLGIYLLAKVAGDMITRGIQQIRNDGIYKSVIAYKMLEEHKLLKPFVNEKNLRSETIIVIDSGEHTQRLIDYLASKKLIVGGGYGKMKGKQVRLANFPTHSKEQFEMLIDLIEKF